MNEDPVTGSTHCMITPYWCKRLNKSRITAFQASSRTGKETEELFRSLLLKKIRLMCIESTEFPRLKMEAVIIIDKDMCVI